MPSNVKLLAGASGGEPTDANFNNVTLLLHGDGSNGAQNNTFIDSSTNNFTITRNGNTTQGSFSPYGSNWSNYFDGSGDYLTAPDNAALQLGSSNFTIEFWVNFSVVPGASQGATLVSKFDTSNTGYEVILYNNTMYFQAQSASIGMTYAWTPTAGRWYHIAWTRSGSNSYGFIDGALVASTSGASGAITNLAQALQLGRRGDNTLYLNGYLSNVRIVKGTAVYTAAFTPPTAPLTAITNTSLLTCTDNRFRDGSTNNFTITRNGDVKVTNFAPFAPSSAYSTTTNGGSAYFDGSGDYLAMPSSTAFQIGTGDFCIEAWIYPTSTAGMYRFIFSGASPNGLAFHLNSNSTITVAKSNVAAYITSTGTAPLNTWTHVAATRSGSTMRIFLNGVLDATATATPDFNGYSSPVIGQEAASNWFPGFISGFRLVKGSAVYTAAFTPPSSPVTAITNTSLLLNATNAAIFDNSMKNDLETVGNAQISTSVKKFGTGSMYFDGSGDYLITPLTPALNLSSGNWTIEGWFYPNNSSTNMVFAMVGNNGSDKIVLATLSPNGYIAYLLNASVVISTTSAVTNNAWSHFALVKNGSTTTLYLNGTSVGTTTSVPTSSDKLFGAGRDVISGGAEVNGYVDEIRITNGVARYTANFTPPTAPFPNK